jgi:hypothetical protein
MAKYIDYFQFFSEPIKMPRGCREGIHLHACKYVEQSQPVATYCTPK